MERKPLTGFYFETGGEAKAFSEGIEYVNDFNDSALHVVTQLQAGGSYIVIVEDEDSQRNTERLLPQKDLASHLQWVGKKIGSFLEGKITRAELINVGEAALRLSGTEEE